MIGLLATAALLLAPAQDLREVKGWLQDGNADLRRRGVAALPAIGTEEAWELVLRALTDPAPRVADEAQLRLGELADAELVADLLPGRDGLKHRDELVRARVTEALGRVPVAVPADLLGTALGDKDPRVRHLAAWSVERVVARAGPEGLAGSAEALTAALQKAARKDRDAGARAAALVAFATLDPAAAGPLVLQSLDSDDPTELCAALEAAKRFPDPSLRNRALEMGVLTDSTPVRRLAVAGLRQAGTRAAVDGLVLVLGQSSASLRARWDAVDALRALSGLRHGLDPAPWREWAGSLPEGWARTPDETRPGDAEGTVSFAGLPLLSDRVVFLVDLSGSMAQGAEGEGSRREVARAELERTLTALPETARFDVVPYVDRPLPWKGRLVAATPANVAKALEHLERTKQTGTGNVWDALGVALTDPEVDTAVVFSDGVPSGGPHWNFELMEALLVQRNRFRHLAIDAVLVDAGGTTRKFWESVCAATGGRCVRAELGGR